MIGENTKPETKCADFVRCAGALASKNLDIAMMKFCYVDITESTDIRALLSSYRAAVDSLRKTAPRVRVVHITAPLAAVTSGWKRVAKTLLGRQDRSAGENIRRNLFNALLADTYRSEPVFDLAAVESTRPDGSRAEFEQDGRKYFALAPEYTDDGGHLNGAGRAAAARALIHAATNALRGVHD